MWYYVRLSISLLVVWTMAQDKKRWGEMQLTSGRLFLVCWPGRCLALAAKVGGIGVLEKIWLGGGDRVIIGL